MELEEVISSAVLDGADLVRIVEDASIRVFFRIDGYMVFRYHAFVASPPAWHVALAASEGRESLDVPAELAVSVAALPLCVKAVHDARIVEIGIVPTEAERAGRKRREAEATARQEAERLAFAAEMAFRDAESRRAPDPDKVAELEKALLATQRVMIPLHVEEGCTGQGQLGGFPDWPLGKDWPHTGAGVPMIFLAQIECPAFSVVPGMPQTGLLQVFYHPESAFGTDLEDGLAVIWHPDPDFVRTPPAAMPPVDPEGIGALEDPARARALLALKPRPCLRNIDDSFLAENPAFERHYGPEQESLLDRRTDPPTEHYVGGWPDPCQDFPYGADTVVLLRLGSDDGMMWSDGGDYHVLIRQADLEARDFGKAWSAFETH